MGRWISFLVIVLWMCIDGECATQTVATWVDNSNYYPYYSIYTGTSWTTPEEISSAEPSHAGGNVYTAYDSINQTTMATWSSNNIGYYAIYQNDSWSSAATIPGITPYGDVSVAFDAYTGQFMVSWADSYPHANVTFYTNGSWGSSTVIGETYTVNTNVYAAFDSSGNAIVTWMNPAFPNQAVYVVYFNGGWLTSVGEIAVPNGGIALDVFISYNPTFGFVATWAANSEQSLYGAYTTISGTGSVNWTSTNFATVSGSEVVEGDIGSSYNPILQETIVGYVPSGVSPSLHYATLNNSGWSSGISTSTPVLNYTSAYTTYDANTETTLAVFPYASSSPGNPYYSKYNGSSWTSDPITTSFAVTDWVYAGPIYATFGPNPPTQPNPPTHLTGLRKVNKFGLVREYYDTLTWDASTSANVVSYVIYANGAKVATVSSSDLSCKVHNQSKNKATVYQVLALDNLGNLSASATVTVN